MAITQADEDAREFYELTPEEQAERTAECKELENNIKADRKAAVVVVWNLARNLYEFKVRSGWTALGYEKQSEWLAQPDINMHYGDFFKLTRMYRVLHLESNISMEDLAQYDHSKLGIALPAIEEHRAPIEQILENVKEWSASDLREEYKGSGVRGKRGGPAVNGTNGSDSGRDERDADDVFDGDVVEGTARDVDAPEPEPEPGPAQDEPVLEDPKLVHAATAVDSWLSVGGDRRKAVRNWKQFVQLHPVLESVRQIQKLIDGDEDAPDRDDAREMWGYIRVALDLKIDDGAG